MSVPLDVLEQLLDQTTTKEKVVGIGGIDTTSESFVAAILDNAGRITNAFVANKIAWFLGLLAANAKWKSILTNSRVQQFILGVLADHADSPDGVVSVGWCIAHMHRENPEGVQLFSTPQTVSVLNKLAHFVNSKESATALHFATSVTLVNNPLLFTPECLTTMCILAANGDTGTVTQVAGALTKLAMIPAGQRVLSIPETASALCSMAKCAKDPSSVQFISTAIFYIIKENPTGLAILATPDLIEEMKKMEEYATTEQSKQFLGTTMQFLVDALPKQPANHQSNPPPPPPPPPQTTTAQQNSSPLPLQNHSSAFPLKALDQLLDQTTTKDKLEGIGGDDTTSESFVAAILDNAGRITNAFVAYKVAWFLGLLAASAKFKVLVTNSRVQQFVVGVLADHADSLDSVVSLAWCVAHMHRENPDGVQVYSTPQTVSALNKLAVFATTHDSSKAVHFALSPVLVNNPLLFTPECLTSLSILAANGDTGTVSQVAATLTKLAKIPNGQRALSIPETASALCSMAKCAKDASNVQFIILAIFYIIKENPTGLAVLATPDLIEEMKQMEQYATTPESKQVWDTTLQLLVDALPKQPTNQQSNPPTNLPPVNQADQKSTTTPTTTTTTTTTTTPPPQVTTTQQNPSPPPLQQQQNAAVAAAAPPPQQTPQQCASTTAAVSSFAPASRVFKRGVPDGLSFNESVAACLNFRELPKDEKGNVTRPDLKDYIPDDDDITNVIERVEEELPNLKKRKSVQDLMANNGITDDDIKALWIYKAENPYPTYKWLNAHMMGQRRDDKIKQTIGPLFVRIYRAMEKLPKIKCKVSRGALVRNIPALRSAFDNYETRFKPGEIVSFWGFGSFSREDSIGGTKFAGDHDQDAIVYSCPEMEGVDMEPFAPSGMPPEAEILPMCPAVFESISAVKIMNTKLVIILKQLSHEKYAYVAPSGK